MELVMLWGFPLPPDISSSSSAVKVFVLVLDFILDVPMVLLESSLFSGMFNTDFIFVELSFRKC